MVCIGLRVWASLRLPPSRPLSLGFQLLPPAPHTGALRRSASNNMLLYCSASTATRYQDRTILFTDSSIPHPFSDTGRPIYSLCVRKSRECSATLGIDPWRGLRRPSARRRSAQTSSLSDLQ